jgi:hypothetical protein
VRLSVLLRMSRLAYGGVPNLFQCFKRRVVFLWRNKLFQPSLQAWEYWGTHQTAAACVVIRPVLQQSLSSVCHSGVLSAEWYRDASCVQNLQIAKQH